MKKLMVLTMAFLATTLSIGVTQPNALAQPPLRWDRRGWGRVADINGQWFMWGDENKPCYVDQRPGSRRALFTNENGDRAWGTIRGNRVFIPDWRNGEGQEGVVRGNRIIWLPDRSYWSR